MARTFNCRESMDDAALNGAVVSYDPIKEVPVILEGLCSSYEVRVNGFRSGYRLIETSACYQIEVQCSSVAGVHHKKPYSTAGTWILVGNKYEDCEQAADQIKRWWHEHTAGRRQRLLSRVK